jgi:hypothetical protein
MCLWKRAKKCRKNVKFLPLSYIYIYRAPDKLRICVFYAMKTSKNACIIRSECTFTHTYFCVSKLSKFGAYLYAVDDNTSCTQELVINYINLFVFDDEIEMKNRRTIQTLRFVTFCTNKSGPFIHETGSGTCNYPVLVRKN